MLPDWLGKRPPVDGDWVKTFDEEFDGPAIDQTKWNIYGPNYWDRASHWTKDNLILEGGMAKFRFEKKRGFHNDNSDPKVKPREPHRAERSPTTPAAISTPTASGCSATATSKPG